MLLHRPGPRSTANTLLLPGLPLTVSSGRSCRTSWSRWGKQYLHRTIYTISTHNNIYTALSTHNIYTLSKHNIFLYHTLSIHDTQYIFIIHSQHTIYTHYLQLYNSMWQVWRHVPDSPASSCNLHGERVRVVTEYRAMFKYI